MYTPHILPTFRCLIARSTTDQPITTKAARQRLANRAEPYWRDIDAGAAVGYRKGAKGGRWLARVRLDGKYQEHGLGAADDALKPDGVSILDYRQAAEWAKEWAAKAHRISNGMEAAPDPAAPYTVANAVKDYLDDFRRRGGKSAAQTERAIKTHILPTLGSIRIDRLSRSRIKTWQSELVDSPPQLRRPNVDKSAKLPRFREVDLNDPEVKRKRRVTVNRILTVLKALLNHAREAGKVTNDNAWDTVRAYKDANAPRVRYLTEAESRRFVESCPEDLRRLVTAALLTGMRYGELSSMQVNDFDATHGTVGVKISKSGKPRHVYLADEGVRFFKQLVKDRSSSELALLRADGSKWGNNHQFRPVREACQKAEISPLISFHILRHTYASRMITRGTPLSVIASQLGHCGTRMTEMHYAHLTPAYVGETVRKLTGDMGIFKATTKQPQN